MVKWKVFLGNIFCMLLHKATVSWVSRPNYPSLTVLLSFSNQTSKPSSKYILRFKMSWAHERSDSRGKKTTRNVRLKGGKEEKKPLISRWKAPPHTNKLERMKQCQQSVVGQCCQLACSNAKNTNMACLTFVCHTNILEFIYCWAYFSRGAAYLLTGMQYFLLQ